MAVHTHPRTVDASHLVKDKVRNREGESLGKIKDIMVDVDTGRILYAVLSYGGFLGMGDKLFAVPWEALQFDEENEVYYLDVDRELLEKAEGFDRDNWPDMANAKWGEGVYRHYGVPPYWL